MMFVEELAKRWLHGKSEEKVFEDMKERGFSKITVDAEYEGLVDVLSKKDLKALKFFQVEKIVEKFLREDIEKDSHLKCYQSMLKMVTQTWDVDVFDLLMLRLENIDNWRRFDDLLLRSYEAVIEQSK